MHQLHRGNSSGPQHLLMASRADVALERAQAGLHGALDRGDAVLAHRLRQRRAARVRAELDEVHELMNALRERKDAIAKTRSADMAQKGELLSEVKMLQKSIGFHLTRWNSLCADIPSLPGACTRPRHAQCGGGFVIAVLPS